MKNLEHHSLFYNKKLECNRILPAPSHLSLLFSMWMTRCGHGLLGDGRHALVLLRHSSPQLSARKLPVEMQISAALFLGVARRAHLKDLLDKVAISFSKVVLDFSFPFHRALLLLFTCSWSF